MGVEGLYKYLAGHVISARVSPSFRLLGVTESGIVNIPHIDAPERKDEGISARRLYDLSRPLARE